MLPMTALRAGRLSPALFTRPNIALGLTFGPPDDLPVSDDAASHSWTVPHFGPWETVTFKRFHFILKHIRQHEGSSSIPAG